MRARFGTHSAAFPPALRAGQHDTRRLEAGEGRDEEDDEKRMETQSGQNSAERRVRTTEAYVPGYVDPIRLRAGEVVAVGHRDQQWTAYLWCSNQRGESGWVPETYLRLEGSHEAVATRDYDGSELTVMRGELLEALDEEGGWFWCRTSLGRLGWLPGDILEDV